jgi:uracil-DNA glycosylase family protein
VRTVTRSAKEPSESAPLAARCTTLLGLKRAAARCVACPLYARATQTVFGEGPLSARMMLVGEQPGDEEDRTGRPFVGPAGRVLDALLLEAGIEREKVYVTNAVKHFKWKPEPRGKRRIHSKPLYGEVHACHGWLEAEIDLIRPEVIVCLGATAAQAFHGPSYRFMKERGALKPSPWAPHFMATYHPAALLRIPDHDARHAARAAFVGDLRKAAALL